MEEERSFSGEYGIAPGPEVAPGFVPCRVILTNDRLQMLEESAGGGSVSVPFHQIEAAVPGDYQLQLKCRDGGVITLRGFGGMSDAFYDGFRETRNNWLSDALLLADRKVLGSFSGTVALPAQEAAGAQIRVYPTSIAFLLRTEVAENLPFSEIADWSFRDEDYAILFRLDSGREVVVRDLAKRTDEFQRLLKSAWTRSVKRAEDTVARICPDLSLLKRRALSHVLRDGIPARRKTLDDIDPGIWPVMEKNILASDLLCATYDWLKERVKKRDGILLGYKDALNPSTPSEDEPQDLIFWFSCLVPASYGTAMAFEIASDEGHASYFFQLDSGSCPESMCRDLRRIQFRREPIHMTEIACRNAKRYELLYAIRKIPALQRLRKAFLGRAIHTSFASWVSQAESILSGSAA